MLFCLNVFFLLLFLRLPPHLYSVYSFPAFLSFLFLFIFLSFVILMMLMYGREALSSTLHHTQHSSHCTQRLMLPHAVPETLIAALREMEATMKRGRSPGLRRQYQTDWPSPPLPPRNPHHGQGPSYTQGNSAGRFLCTCSVLSLLINNPDHGQGLNHMQGISVIRFLCRVQHCCCCCAYHAMDRSRFTHKVIQSLHVFLHARQYCSCHQQPLLWLC